MKKGFSIFLALVSIFVMIGVVSAEVNPVTPSTNDINRTNEWAHVNQLTVGVGETDLQFVSTRGFWSCFEYRTDGDTSQKIGDTNYNVLVTDGLYPYFCENNSTSVHTIYANEYVEVRMVFGAETDERFDWTRFDVEALPVAEEKDQCKDDGWKELYRSDGSPFKNQGDCIQYVNTGK